MSRAVYLFYISGKGRKSGILELWSGLWVSSGNLNGSSMVGV